MVNSRVNDYIYPHTNWLVRTQFSPYALNHAKRIVNNWIDDQAVKRKHEEWITIDWIESLDLDDWIWVERTKKWYAVFVSISDVSEWIQEFSPLDIEALKRTTSIYLRDRVNNMIPEILSQDFLSLNQNWKKLTLTMRIELDQNWEILDFDVYESIFTNRQRYDYEGFHDDFINPDSQNHNILHLMYEIALKRKQSRLRNWANAAFDDSDRQLEICKQSNMQFSAWKAIASTIVSEFMILANLSAGLIAVKNSFDSVFRLQKWQKENAFYSPKSWAHSSLALVWYTHFTSPIRRYIDIVVHRILKLVYLRWEEHPYRWQDLQDIVRHVNFSRTLIWSISKWLSYEIKWQEAVEKVKKRNWWTITTSDLTLNIRNSIAEWRKIPKAIVNEIIWDLQSWVKSNWAWAIWIFLISWNKEITDILKRIILEEKRFDTKAVLSILNNTVIARWDKENIFDIQEEVIWNQIRVIVYFKWQKLFSCACNFTSKYAYNEAIWDLRKKALEKIFIHFCGK